MKTFLSIAGCVLFISTLIGCAGHSSYPEDWGPTLRSTTGDCPDIEGTYDLTPAKCSVPQNIRSCDEREELDTMLGIFSDNYVTIRQKPDGDITISTIEDPSSIEKPSQSTRLRVVAQSSYTCTPEAVILEIETNHLIDDHDGQAATYSWLWGTVELLPASDGGLIVHKIDKYFGCFAFAMPPFIGCCVPAYSRVGFWIKFEPWRKTKTP